MCILFRFLRVFRPLMGACVRNITMLHGCLDDIDGTCESNMIVLCVGLLAVQVSDSTMLAIKLVVVVVVVVVVVDNDDVVVADDVAVTAATVGIVGIFMPLVLLL